MSCGERPPPPPGFGRRPLRGDFRGTMPATHSSTLVNIKIETDDGSLEARLRARNKAETGNGSLEVLQQSQRQSEVMASQSRCQTKSSLAGKKNASPRKGPYKRVRADATKVTPPGVNASNTAQHLRPCKKSKGLGEHGKLDDNQGSTEVRRPQTPINLFEDECVFCHSFRTCEKFHGPMVLYRKGRIVSTDEGNPNNAIFVHKKCMYWAPRVYFDVDKIVNMEKEISRSSRLKCSRCRLPGAALGCFHHPCPQNYHVPCAVMIPECRWDMKNLHVWCPKHASDPLPCDVTSSTMETDITLPILRNQCSDKEGLSADYPREEEKTNQSRTLVNQWVLLGSVLSASEKDSLNEFASLTNSTLAEECNKNVTHVIVGKSAGITCGRSYEVLMAILCGKWVVRAGWIVDCLAKQIPGSKTCLAGPITVPEISYEVEFFDASHISIDGPRKARAGAAEGAPKLFSGLHFCLSAYMDPELRENIENLIAAAQGKVQEAQENVGKNSSKVYFICDGSPPRDSTDKVIEEAEKYAAWGAQVTCHLWLFDAIASYDARMLEWSYREARKMLLGVDFSKC